jgi:hypothetical protein
VSDRFIDEQPTVNDAINNDNPKKRSDMLHTFVGRRKNDKVRADDGSIGNEMEYAQGERE